MKKKKAIDILNERIGVLDENAGKKHEKKKTKARRKAKEKTNTEINETIPNETELEAEELERRKKQSKSEIISKQFSRVICVFLSIMCVYTLFLMYGLINTKYIYAEDGQVVPQIMTVEKIEDLNEFNDFANSYRQTRMLYEKVLTLDYRIMAGVEDPLVIAPEYEMLLEDVEALTIDLQAASYSSNYIQLNNMLLQWVKTDVSVYCQRMSQSISQNNSDYATQALEYKQLMYSDYSLITANLISLGKTVYGADIRDVEEWSPELFVKNHIE